MLYLKALHIIGVVVWFSGLFYIGRLFVYHQEASYEAEPKAQILKDQFTLMEKRLWYAITTPGMILTLVMGLSLMAFFKLPTWLAAKLIFVALLMAYHMACSKIRKQLASNQCKLTSKQLRLFNELPSLLLISIVFIVVLKSQLSLPLLGFILGSLGVVIGAVIYSRKTTSTPNLKESKSL